MPREFGQIVLAPVPDGHGNVKVRPVVILTPTKDIQPGGPLDVACVSTHIEQPVPPDHIPLPWHRHRHPRTGLDRPNVVKCDWLATIADTDIRRELGFVPARQLLHIAEALRRLAKPPDDETPEGEK